MSKLDEQFRYDIDTVRISAVLLLEGSTSVPVGERIDWMIRVLVNANDTHRRIEKRDRVKKALKS